MWVCGSRNAVIGSGRIFDADCRDELVVLVIGCRYDHFDVCVRKVLSQLSSSNAAVARQVRNAIQNYRNLYFFSIPKTKIG